MPDGQSGLEFLGGDLPALDDEQSPGGQGPRFTRRWARTQPKGSRVLVVMLTGTLVLGVAAGMVARGFISPIQLAARAQGPVPSLITTQVRYGVLPVLVSLRADVSDGHPVAVLPPPDLGGALPEVTSVDVAIGQRVRQGLELLTVAERPVFVFKGSISAFRVMSLGTRGQDVQELQAGLAAAGFGVGQDRSGVYGPGTAAAVLALYRAAGVPPAWTGSPTRVHQLSAQVSGAMRSLARARAKLAADQGAGAAAPVLAADKAAVHAAQQHVTGLERALAGAQRALGAKVPLGEVAFVPALPARVMSVVRPGMVDSKGTPLAEIGSDRVRLTAPVGPAQVGQLRAGMMAKAFSDVSGQSFRVRISSVGSSRVEFMPAGHLPKGLVGQNVEVTVVTSRVRTFIVPVAAVSTALSGQTYLQVEVGSGGQLARVAVRLGLASGGEQAVSPTRAGALRTGQQVVIGIGATR